MANHIRVIALCLLRRGDAFLVSVEPDAVKGDAFCRFLGGGVEWGERSHEALVRELREELGAELENVRPYTTLENLFVYNGQSGHEVVFVYEADFADPSLYEQDFISAYEVEIDAPFTAQWLSLREMDEQGIRFVPEALRPMLESSSWKVLCPPSQAQSTNEAVEPSETSPSGSP